MSAPGAVALATPTHAAGLPDNSAPSDVNPQTPTLHNASESDGTGVVKENPDHGKVVSEGNGENPNERGDVVDQEEQYDDEEDEDEDEEEEEINIREELGDILEGGLEFTGAISYNKTYPTAPNPVLDIEGLGTVGLPLGLRDAAAIKACAEQAPFGMADQTVIDKTVRDTWEIDGRKVNFENAAWHPFLQGILRDVCQALGVNFDASKPRCELYKLLLYETGSHFLPHVDTEKVDGMFATIVVVLPSKFTGGAVHVSHGGFSETYEHSARSQTETTVLAWYTDVEHAVKPITSGYRLALSFNVIHTTNSLRPVVSKASDAAVRLRRILKSWAEDNYDAPDKIIYLLDHKYSQANMSGSALKGSDAHLVAMLDSVGRPLGFHLGLANLTCTQRGSAVDSGCGYRGYGRRRGGWGSWYDDEDEDEDEDEFVEMEEVEQTDVDIEHLVDMDGKLIRETINFDVETDVIPQEVAEEITASHHDDQSYEGYMGNYAGSLERFYRRTVLVIWPPFAHFDIIHGGRGLEYACEKVRASTGPRPTQEELELVNLILSRYRGRTTEIVSSVCRAAFQWRDVALWARAVQTCSLSVAALKDDHIYEVVATFGFALLHPSLEFAVRMENSNVHAIQFLDNFENWVERQRSEELTASAIPPGPLITLVLKHRDVEFLEKSVLPLAKSYQNPLTLKCWASDLHNTEAIPAEARARMVREILSAAMAIVDFWKVQKPLAPPTYALVYHRPTEVPEELKRAKEYAQTCLDVNCEDLFAFAVPKLLAFEGLQENMIQLRVKEVILPLIAYVSAAAHSRPVAGLSELSEKALALHLKATLADSRNISQADIAGMIQASAMTCGQPDFFLTGIIPKLEALNLQDTQLRAIMEEVHAKRALLDPSDTKVQPVLLRLLKKWVSIVNLTSTTYGTSYYGQQSPKPAIPVLEFCLTLRLPEVCTIVTKRLLHPARLDAEYIKNQLAPLLPDLSALLGRQKQPLSSPTFVPLFSTIMLYYTEKVLGPRPADTLSKHVQALNRWTCSCELCPSVRRFLTSEATERREWQRIGAPKRRHVEQFLNLHARSLATYTLIRTTPQGLTVTKAKELVAPARWVEHQKKGLDMLKSISADPAVVKTVLGDDHAKISALLLGRPFVNAPVPAGPSVAATADANPVHAAAAQLLAGPSHAGAAVASTSAMAAASAANANKRPYSAAAPGVAQLYPANSVPGGIPASASATVGPSNVAARPAKRRKTTYDEKDIIDLT
ncbi:hypothetical protein GSI_06057 [Ganoderma sinense ZZ0214-1]|uniref:Fe2OG dioxygenase domain-containing protein n=1 Tax=Ganoderma sinense ZZ0214-1 TaxID=1077348 RepID=A0A2G8SCP4_9APHY|nr:hypothetical protein GSI_06057 [Ganoderma sinense ZZ0214-1]